MTETSKRHHHPVPAVTQAGPARGNAARARRKHVLLLGVAIIIPGAFAPDAALAACAPGTLCVTQATDIGDISSVGSFSWAIAQANTGGNQTISFDSTVFSGANTTLTLSGTNVQTPRVTAGVTIDGSGVPNLIIDGSGQREILFLRPDAPNVGAPIAVTIKGVTLANGRAQGGAGGGGGYGGGGGMGAGGAIYVGAGVALTAENVNLAGNVAKGGAGGATSSGQTGSGGGGLNGGAGVGRSSSGGPGGAGGGTGRGANGVDINGGGPAGGAGAVGTGLAQDGGAYSGGGAAIGGVVAGGSPFGGNGGWGGGGGGGGKIRTNDLATPRGGAGGFGGGGGGGANDGQNGVYTPGGAGGFGAGAGGGYSSNTGTGFALPGFGGGRTGTSFVGGGGAGFGGALFVEEGGSVTLVGAGTVSGGGASGSGTGIGASLGLGSGFYLHGTTALTVAAAAGETLSILDAIASDAYADPASPGNADPAGDGLDGGVIHNGAGTLQLHGANSYAGGTTINSGTVNVIADNGLGHASGAVTLNGGALQWGAAFDTARAIHLLGGDNSLDTRAFDATLTGLIDGPDGFTKRGTGTLTLTGANSYAGGTRLDAGTVSIAQDVNLGAAAGALTFDGGTLQTTTSVAMKRATTLLSGGGIFETAAVTTLTQSGAISGAGALTKSGVGTLRLQSANSYTGATTILTGTLALAGAGSIATSSGVEANGIFDISGAGAVASIQTLSGTGTVALGNRILNLTNASSSFAGGIQGTGGLTLAAGTQILTGTSDYTGITTIAGGELRLENGGQITATSSMKVGDASGQIAALAVDGTGSKLVAVGPTTSVGYSGTGVLNIQAGGRAEFTTLLIGSNGTGNGTVNVIGVGSSLSAIPSKSYIGFGGAGALNILDGGTASYTGAAQIGFNAGAKNGTVVVSGAGSRWTVGGVLSIANGFLSVLDGGFVSSGSNFTITDAGSKVAALTLTRSGTARAGNGTLAMGEGNAALNIGGVENGSATGAGILDATNVTFGSANSRINFNHIDSGYVFGAAISGLGAVNQVGSGTTILTGANSYAGGTTITSGILQLGDGGTTGSITGNVTTHGVLAYNRSDALPFAGLISGTGVVSQFGTGTTILTGTNNYTGGTAISRGTLRINGDQTAATGVTAVYNGATLGGSGIIGGSVAIADGGKLAPGNSPGTLTINGDLVLMAGALLDFELGTANVAGGPLNDLIKVGGNLVLDGTINIVPSAGGTFGPGIYRLIDYTGTLTNEGLLIGSSPTTNLSIQTSVAKQVNLINTAGLVLRFWDGDAGPKNNQVINGGDGTWEPASGNDNWTADGDTNAGFQDEAFAVFQGDAGTVTVNNSLGAINVSGMQFATDGYLLQGDAINLAAPQTIIRVGDDMTGSGDFVATITAALAGTGALIKADEGTLVLRGFSRYAGGTVINGGTLQVAHDANLGDAAGGLAFGGGTLRTTANIASARAVTLDGAGTFLTDTGTTLTLSGALSGAGLLTKDGAGALILTGDNVYTGGTMIAGGALQIGNGGTTGSVIGDVVNNGILSFRRSDTLTYGGAISGTGLVDKYNANTLILTGDSSHSGGTSIRAGTLQIGDGSTTGSLAGDVLNDGALVFNRSDALTFAGAISGGGHVYQSGAGTTTLTGTNSYTADTIVNAGTLRLAAGGQITANSSLLVARDNGQVASVIVDGAGSHLNALRGVGISVGDGDGSTGTLDIVNGGTVAARTMGLGFFSTGHGTINVTGTGSSLTTDQPYIASLGAYGTGTLNVLDGGYVESSDTVQFGYYGGQGIATVSGENSGWDIGLMLDLQNGTLSVLDGGVVSADVIAIARSPDSLPQVNEGQVIVSGAGSSLTSATSLTIGGDATTGALTIADGGAVTVGDGMLAMDQGNAALNIGGAEGAVATGAGVLNATSVAMADAMNRVNFNHSDAGYVFGATILGAGGLNHSGSGTTILTADNNYIGLTAIAHGVLQLGNGGTTGGIVSPFVLNNGTLAFKRSDSVTFRGLIIGAGAVSQIGTGTTILTAENNYFGGTTIGAGVLQLGNGATGGSIIGDVVDHGVLAFNRADSVTFAGLISGTGAVLQIGTGTTILTGTNSYAGGTTINAGVLQVSSNVNLGAAAGGLTFNGGVLRTTGDVNAAGRAAKLVANGTVNTDGGTTLTLGGVVSGIGSIAKQGLGTLTLSGANSYSGNTDVLAGTLRVNGDQSDATAVTRVGIGATLGGSGTIGGHVLIDDGGRLAPGNSAGTLTINGTLLLNNAAILDYEFGQANVPGGAYNDLVNVGGDLTLDGTLNVTVPTGRSFGAGVYRVINYAGALTDNGLTLGTIPATDLYVQTSVANEVNLVNMDGLTLNIWDGDAGPKNDGAVNGGDGLWQNSAGNENWTEVNGLVNARYADGALAIFQGTAGIVAVDNSLGAVNASGLQFAADGYLVQGDALTLVGPDTTIRVGDGSEDGAAYVATITADLTGTTQLVKDDFGTFVLSGAKSYTGGTAINAGTLRITNDASLGALAGGIEFGGGTLQTSAMLRSDRPVTLTGAGTVLTDGGTALTLGGPVSGAGMFIKDGAGSLVLVGDASHSGGTTIAAGTLQIGAGGTSGSLTGDVVNHGTLAFDRSNGALFDGAISGSGALAQNGGQLILTGTNSYSGGTTIANGRALWLGNGGISGSIAGNVANEGVLIFRRSDAVTFDGVISGTGLVGQTGTGTTILTGNNSYTGVTHVLNGTLLIDGDQSAATGLTVADTGATLGGAGIIGGNVVVIGGGMLAPGHGVGTLTINGDLSMMDGAVLNFELGQAYSVGGPLNDLLKIGGDLVLDGTLNVAVSADGLFGPGIYRLINYAGALTDNGLAFGTMPIGSETLIQTSIAHQVNLINTAGLTFNYWDGAAGPKNDSLINGGDGVWQTSSGNDNWTEASGSLNAPYADGAMAIFAGAKGTVSIDNSLGAVNASGIQFMSSGYVLQGDALTLVGPQASIRVGDGTADGAVYSATIASELAGASQLVKDDFGTLILADANSYTGGTAINGGILQISSDANLGDAAGGLTFDGGTLRTTADISSARDVTLTGAGTFLTDSGTTLSFGGLVTGTGALTKDGGGTVLLTGDNSAYTGTTLVRAGILSVSGSVGGTAMVAAGARLEGDGSVGAIANQAGGIVAPGRDGIGTLTVAGAYTGNGGALEIETVLGGDASASDRLIVNGATSGTTQVTVRNRGGLGAQTSDGIKIIEVAGASDGVFALNGDYQFGGEQAVIAGAYGYRLYQNGVSSPADGDWYLRSVLLNDDASAGPLYQPGVPVYEAYAQTLLALNGVPTLQQRVGNRSWANGGAVQGAGIWGRTEGVRNRPQAVASTSQAETAGHSWKMQMGVDRVLQQDGNGGALVGGLTVQYGTASTNVSSLFGSGRIETKGVAVGAMLSWYGPDGVYIDGHAQLSWYDSDLTSVTLATLAKGNDGKGRTLSVEVGKRASVGGALTITPQIQMVYSAVDFDSFADPAGALVSAAKGDSLKTRGGLSLDYQSGAQSGSGQTHLYGVANISYEWLDGTQADVSGTTIVNRDTRLWSELGVGGSYSWGGGRYSLYSEVSANTALRGFGDSYSLKATAGFRARF